MGPFISQLKRTYWEVIDLEKKSSGDDPDPYPVCEIVRSASDNNANTISSLLDIPGNLHAPCIDIDWHCELRVLSSQQELDIWCKWPQINGYGQPKLTVDELDQRCIEMRKFGFRVLFRGNFESIRYRFISSLQPRMVLVPSRSYDHFHWYIEQTLSWKQYEMFLDLLNQLGIVQNGFFGMTVSRGMSHLRKPSPDHFITAT